MRTLFTLRHAKSSWDDQGLADFDRPLNSRGIEAARFMGELIYTRGLTPQRIISSPAKRAKQTAVLVAEIGGVGSKVVYDDRIYEASSLALFNVVRELEDSLESVMIVGHNPGMEDLVRLLTGSAETLPTAALTKISLRIPRWSALDVRCGKLELVIRPKEEQAKAGLR